MYCSVLTVVFSCVLILSNSLLLNFVYVAVFALPKKITEEKEQATSEGNENEVEKNATIVYTCVVNTYTINEYTYSI